MLLAFAPFWIFLILFKFAGGLHYSLVSPLGEQLLPLWIVGLVMGGASLVQLLLDVPAGQLLDRFGYRKLLLITTAIFLLAALCLTFEFTLGAYLLSITLSIFGWLFFGPGVNAYILSSAPKEVAARFMSLKDVFNSTGIVIAASLLPFALLFTPSNIGVFLAGLFVFALAALALAPKDQNSVHAEEKLPTQHYYVRRQLKGTLKAMKRLNPASTMLALLNMAGGLFYGTIWFTVPLILAHEVDNQFLGFGLGVFDFSVVVLGFLLGTLADKFDRKALVFIGLLMFAICGMLLGLGFGILFILFGFLATTGDELAELSLWSWLHALDKDHAHDGAIAGVINLFEDVGWMIGPMMAGVLYTFVGPSWTIVVGAVPIFVVWLVYWLVFEKHAIPRLSLTEIPKKPHRRRYKL